MQHIYIEKIELGAYYTYDKKQNKVYDFKSMRQDFKQLLKDVYKKSNQKGSKKGKRMTEERANKKKQDANR